MATDFLEKVQDYIEKYHMIKKGRRVLAGVSGGADSVCLLLVLHELEKRMGFSLAAVHVEHGIRGGESLSDALFTETLCRKLGVPFRRFSVDAPGYAVKTRRSLEEAARELRYGCFALASDEWGADGIAVAHHANDNAETMLFHLVRGSGIRGLGGIAPVVSYHVGETVRGVIGRMSAEGCRMSGDSMCIFRPLLCVTRTEIEEFLGVRGQSYCTDGTNADLSYTRNRIRDRVLPELMEVNAQALPHMAKTAGRLREICAYLEEAAFREGADAYRRIYCKRQRSDIREGESPFRMEASRADWPAGEVLPIEKIQIYGIPFLALHQVLRTTLAHSLIGEIAGSKKDITSEHVMQVLALFDMSVGKRTDLPYGISARRFADGVELYHREELQSVPAGRKGMDGIRAVGGNGRFGNGCTVGSLCENEMAGADICLDLPVPGELFLANGCRIRADVFPFDGNFEKIPKKRYTKWMDYDKIINCSLQGTIIGNLPTGIKVKGDFQIRTRRPGDYLQIDAQGGRKKLKRYFIDEKIPAAEREHVLLVASGSHILWIIGHRMSEGCKVTGETRCVLCLQYQGTDIVGDDI